MYAHERSLVQRYQNKPFVLLGVNSDPDRQALPAIMAREGISWRSWCDGSPSGPISSRYHVESWPTIYILDAQGVIRYTQVRGQALDSAVETLLNETEPKRSRSQDARL